MGIRRSHGAVRLLSSDWWRTASEDERDDHLGETSPEMHVVWFCTTILLSGVLLAARIRLEEQRAAPTSCIRSRDRSHDSTYLIARHLRVLLGATAFRPAARFTRRLLCR
jgi:hypothetical protein